MSLAFGQTQFGSAQTKTTQLISCAQLLSLHIRLHIKWAAQSFDSVQHRQFSKMTFTAQRCAMSVSHFLSAALNMPTASNYDNQGENKYKWNLHFSVLSNFWWLRLIITLRTAVLETWILLPCDFYRFDWSKYVRLCNNSTKKEKKPKPGYPSTCQEKSLLSSQILTLEKADLRRTESSSLRFSELNLCSSIFHFVLGISYVFLNLDRCIQKTLTTFWIQQKWGGLVALCCCTQSTLGVLIFWVTLHSFFSFLPDCDLI